jgi:WbqC-like protein family
MFYYGYDLAKSKVLPVTTLVVLQPGYLPWLGYFDQMQQADIFVHLDDVSFDKHGWRNRNQVKGPKGASWLTVPILHSGRFGQSILDVEIDYRRDWQRKHLATLRQFYARAPFVETVIPQLIPLIERRWERLVDLDLAIVDWLASTLGITTPCFRSSQLGIAGERSDRLLSLCQNFAATRYLSGSAARDYLDVDKFSEAGIQVVWQDYAHPTYRQQHGSFVAYLSTIDLILNEGPASLGILSS